MITKYKLYFLTLVVSLLLLGCASKQNFIDQSKSITKETYTYHTFENEKNFLTTLARLVTVRRVQWHKGAWILI